MIRTVLYKEVNLDIEFEYYKGEPVNLSGHPDTWHDGSPEELEIIAIKLNGVKVDDLLEDQIEDIEQELWDDIILYGL